MDARRRSVNPEGYGAPRDVHCKINLHGAWIMVCVFLFRTCVYACTTTTNCRGVTYSQLTLILGRIVCSRIVATVVYYR